MPRPLKNWPNVSALIGILASLQMTSLAFAEEQSATISPEMQGWMSKVASCCVNRTQDGCENGILKKDGTPPQVKESDAKAKKGEDYAECICNNLKGHHEIHNSQLVQYCTTLETAKLAHGMDIALTVLDGAAASACWAACYNPMLAGPCNCAAMIDGSVDFGYQMKLFAKTLEYQDKDQITAMQVLTGPILGGLGIVMGGPTACIPGL